MRTVVRLCFVQALNMILLYFHNRRLGCRKTPGLGMTELLSTTFLRKEPLPVSVVLIARNEEHNIARCLASLQWANEVVVVDNESTDGTQDVARSFPNVTLVCSEWLGFSETKRVGLKAARNNWIFWVDADEVFPPRLQQEIAAQFSPLPVSETLAFAVDRKTYFLGRWVKGCGWFPSRVVRLFHRGHADFNNNVLHEGVQLKSTAQVHIFSEPLLHDSYVSLKSYFSKMVRYGELGALELSRKGHTSRFIDLMLRPLAAFLRSYFFRLGLRDGVAGVVVSVGTAFSVFIKYGTYYYYKRNGTFEKRRDLEHWEKS